MGEKSFSLPYLMPNSVKNQDLSNHNNFINVTTTSLDLSIQESTIGGMSTKNRGKGSISRLREDAMKDLVDLNGKNLLKR